MPMNANDVKMLERGLRRDGTLIGAGVFLGLSIRDFIEGGFNGVGAAALFAGLILVGVAVWMKR